MLKLLGQILLALCVTNQDAVDPFKETGYSCSRVYVGGKGGHFIEGLLKVEL